VKDFDQAAQAAEITSELYEFMFARPLNLELGFRGISSEVASLYELLASDVRRALRDLFRDSSSQQTLKHVLLYPDFQRILESTGTL